MTKLENSHNFGPPPDAPAPYTGRGYPYDKILGTSLDFSRDQRGLRGSRRGESARKVRNDIPRGNMFTKVSEESSYSSIREVGQGRAITSTSRFSL